MKKILSTLLILYFLSSLATAQEKLTSPIKRRANDVISVINDPKDFEKTFSKSFLAQVSPNRLTRIVTQLVANYGTPVRVQKIETKNEYSAVVLVYFDKGFIVTLNLDVESSGTNLVSGLRITAVEKSGNSLQGIVDDLKKLPGKTSLLAAKLNAKGFESIISHNSDESLAIGSTFKLYILSELVRQIAIGKRNWSDVVELEHFSLPSGQLQNFEKGSPFTLHTLASMMISISDNTAADQLLRTLGREKVEGILEVTGNSNPELNMPFLATAEMFKLKGIEKQKYAITYVSADRTGKRKILANEIANLSVGDISLVGFLAKPTYISEIEWFASANDLVRLMNWLRMNTEKPSTNQARGVMAINKALPKSASSQWKYVGFKGGSETGVISMTYLLASKKGEWFVLTSSWNDEKSPVNQTNFALLVQSAVKSLLEQTK